MANYPTVIVEAGQIKSKSNYRRSANTKWSDISSFEMELGVLLRQARPSDWVNDLEEKVADRPRVVAVIIARTMLDAGNLSKSVLDAAEGTLFQNDSSVGLVMEYADRGKSGQCSVVAFAQLPAEATREEMAKEAAKLFASASEVFDTQS